MINNEFCFLSFFNKANSIDFQSYQWTIFSRYSVSVSWYIWNIVYKLTMKHNKWTCYWLDKMMFKAWPDFRACLMCAIEMRYHYLRLNIIELSRRSCWYVCQRGVIHLKSLLVEDVFRMHCTTIVSQNYKFLLTYTWIRVKMSA